MEEWFLLSLPKASMHFKAKSLKQTFDISTNINDDYKIIDIHLKNLLLQLKQENVGKKISCCLNSDINNHHYTQKVDFLFDLDFKENDTVFFLLYPFRS